VSRDSRFYHGEKQLLEALPRMAKAAATPQLQQAFTSHLRETEGQVKRLEQILREMGLPARGKRCKGMEGLLEEEEAADKKLTAIGEGVSTPMPPRP
jgi:ferritin-like metal-binding protein YciE